MKTSSCHCAGFTLLEVMLALAILAIAGMSVLSMTGGVVKNTPIVEQRVLASLVADNMMVDLHLDKQQLTQVWKRDNQVLADQEWPVRFRRLPTELTGFQALEVEILDPENESVTVLTTLRSYVGIN